ncbi:early nodulin-like protein 14, partial [Rosa rugosa]|uniref:early nodulin-like protein 14 n=1 Tax=Rosa rugosa TaxID=74645 RepID=UPI002B4170AA
FGNPILLRIAVIAFAAMLHSTEAVDYKVGDDLGWTIPPDGADPYADWSLDCRAYPSFDFPVGEQDVAFVTKEDFEPCTTTNPLWESPVPDEVTLVQSAGTFYFIGTFTGHCAKGQKVAVNWTNSPVMTPA